MRYQRKNLRVTAAGTIIATLLWALLTPGPGFTEDSREVQDAAARHKAFLQWEVGEWDAEITMPDPAGGEPQIYRATQTDRLAANGQWLLTDLELVASGNGAPLPPYEGHGVLGFDPAKQRLTGIWADSRTSWLAVSEGTVSPDGKTLKLEVEGRDPATGAAQTWEFVTTQVGPDRRRLEVLVPVAGDQKIQAAVIEYERR